MKKICNSKILKYILTTICIVSSYLILYYPMQQFILFKYTKYILFIIPVVLYFISIKLLHKRFNIVHFILLIGIILRFIYINYTNYDVRQYDVTNTECGPAHLDYAYILSEGKLPETNEWQTYHPPLNAIIQGSWIHLTKSIHDTVFTLEGLQMFSLLYSVFILFIVFDLLDLLHFDKKRKIPILLLTSFHPSLIYMAGGLNNDSPFIFLSVAFLYWLCKFMKNNNICNLLVLSCFVALGMMTKNTGLLHIIVVIMYLLYRMIRTNKFKTYFKYIIIFLLITISLGCWYQIRNYILFNQSFTYVSYYHWDFMYLGNYTILERLGLPSIHELFSRISSSVDTDYQVIPYILRNSISGVWGIPENIISMILYITNIILIIITFVSLAISVFHMKKNSDYINFLLILDGGLLMSYLLFIFKFPYACAMEYRYIVSSCIIGILVLDELIWKHFSHLYNIYHKIIIFILAIFSICAFTTLFSIL